MCRRSDDRARCGTSRIQTALPWARPTPLPGSFLPDLEGESAVHLAGDMSELCGPSPAKVITGHAKLKPLKSAVDPEDGVYGSN